MKFSRLITVLFLLLGFSTPAWATAPVQIATEDFTSLSQYTPASFGTNLSAVSGTLNSRLYGPTTTGKTSATARSVQLNGGANYAQMAITGAATSKAQLCADFNFSSATLNGSGIQLMLTNGVQFGTETEVYVVSGTPNLIWVRFNLGGTNASTGVAMPIGSAFTLMLARVETVDHYVTKVYLQVAGGTPTVIATSASLYNNTDTLNYWRAGIIARAGGNTAVGRMGAMWMGSISALTDTAVPASYSNTWPTAPTAWALDTVNGNDSNEGTPAAPIKTITELNTRLSDGSTFAKVAPATTSVSALTYTGGVGTVTSTAHGLVAGQTFQLKGARVGQGAWPTPGGTVLSATTNSFTFTPLYLPTPYAVPGVLSGGTTTATGTITCAGFALGDVWSITAPVNAPLDVGIPGMLIVTRGVTVKPLAGQQYFYVQAWKDVSGATAGGSTTWALSAGTTKTYETTDGSATDLTSVVGWEADKWPTHPTGAAFSNVKSAMDAVAGSWYSDGTKIYLHPLGDTNPNTDGKIYTRSRARAGGNPAINLNAFDVQLFGAYVGKTCVAVSTDSTSGQNQGVTWNGNAGGTGRTSGCYVYYASKHAIGQLDNSTGCYLLVDGNITTQGTPYEGGGGYSAYVSDNGGASATTNGDTHTFVNNADTLNVGLIGSSAGTVNLAMPSWLCHPVGYAEINHIANNFCASLNPQNTTSGPAALNVFGGSYPSIGGSWQAGLFDRVRTTAAVITPGSGSVSTTITNSIMVWGASTSMTLGDGHLGNYVVFGTLTLLNDTIDMSQAVITDTANAAPWNRSTGALNVTVKNTIFLNNGASNAPSLFGGLLNTDTVSLGTNAFQIAAGGVVLKSYNDGSTTANRTLAQAQTLTLDSGSISATSGVVNTDYTLPGGSPARGLGASIIQTAGLPDFFGKVRPAASANVDAGAAQYSSTPSSTGIGMSLSIGL